MPQYIAWMVLAAAACSLAGPAHAATGRAARVQDLARPIGNPLYVMVTTADKLEVGTVETGFHVGPLSAMMMNTNGESLLLPLTRKLGGRTFQPVLEEALSERLDPAAFGTGRIAVDSLSGAPLGARVLGVSGHYTISRDFKTLMVGLQASLCERKDTVEGGCDELYRNMYYYEFGLPDDALKLWRKGQRAKRWAEVPDEEFAQMIVEGLQGAVDLINFDFNSFGAEPVKAGGTMRHFLPEGVVFHMRFVSEKGGRTTLRWGRDGYLFSIESRLPEP